MTANIDKRAKRRYNELRAQGCEIDLAKLKAAMIERDSLDKNRNISPLIKATDAIEVDNSDCLFTEMVDKIVKMAHTKINTAQKLCSKLLKKK